MSASSGTLGIGKIKYKIVLLGDQCVGKTSIIQRFIHDKYECTYSATIGIDFLVRNLTHQNRTYRLQLWDTAGQQRFKSMIPSYLKDSICCILVYDLTCPNSLKNIIKWVNLYFEHRDSQTAICFLVGNKSDLERQCTDEAIEETTRILKLKHFEVSAKSGKGVQEMFIEVVNHVNICLEQNKKRQNAIIREVQPQLEDLVSVKPLRIDKHQVVIKKQLCC